jgi:hypothetical protein
MIVKTVCSAEDSDVWKTTSRHHCSQTSRAQRLQYISAAIHISVSGIGEVVKFVSFWAKSAKRSTVNFRT